MSPLRPHRNRRVAALTALLAATTLAACGSDGDPSADAVPVAKPVATPRAATSYPLTIDNCGEKITFDRAPKRVVLLNGSSVGEVENFVKLGIDDSIVANSQSYGVSDEPGMAKRIASLPRGGLKLNENFEVPREQVLALKPDLVVSTWAGGFDPKIGSISREELAKSGIASYVTPSNCGNGDPTPRPQDTERYENQTVESSFGNLVDLGKVFDVQAKAADYVGEQRRKLDAAAPDDAGERPSVLLAVPGMSAMNANGVPAIFGGKIYDDIVARAGGVNAFPDLTDERSAQLNVEALASAKVDVLIIGQFTAQEDPRALAEGLFRKFPGWEASKTKTWGTVSDGMYPGPLNALAVEKIAAAVNRAR